MHFKRRQKQKLLQVLEAINKVLEEEKKIERNSIYTE